MQEWEYKCKMLSYFFCKLWRKKKEENTNV